MKKSSSVNILRVGLKRLRPLSKLVQLLGLSFAIFTPSHSQATIPTQQQLDLEKRIAAVREKTPPDTSDTDQTKPDKLAQWPNWPNWSNWPNWPNWYNY